MLGNNPPPYRGPTCCRAESLGCFLCRAVSGNFFTVPREGPCFSCLNAHLVQCLNRFLIVKRFALSGAFFRHCAFREVPLAAIFLCDHDHKYIRDVGCHRVLLCVTWAAHGAVMCPLSCVFMMCHEMLGGDGRG